MFAIFATLLDSEEINESTWAMVFDVRGMVAKDRFYN
tara:strand:- start:1397 stop:1507 length:111 start_codon:yes stop_codon:yes gene_type:complete